METIQFGGVIVDMRSYKIVEDIDIYVKPKIHPKLTDFCVELTGITDERLERKGVSLGELCGLLGKKIKPYKHQLEWAGWGAFDGRFLSMDMKRAGLEESYPLRDIKYNNLSYMFQRAQNAKRKMGLRKAMRKCNIEFSGRHHNGYFDAYNTSKLLPFILPKQA